MSIEKLKRVIWRLKELNKLYLSRDDIYKAIVYEIGTDNRTYYSNAKVLKKLKWIVPKPHTANIWMIGDNSE